MNSGQFFRRLLFGDYRPDGFWARINYWLLAHLPLYRGWHLRREKARMIQACNEIRQAQIDTMRKGLALLESLEPYVPKEKSL
jgi:hypothetical protein